jgi:catechol 2,3-dioxygenase-like lactoylglutathione lyase family enzyme
VKLETIDHIGILVQDVDEALRLLVDGLGLELELRSEDDRRRLAFVRCGSARIELLQLRDPEARQRRLGGRRAWIEHLAFAVEELPPTVDALAALGVRLDGTPVTAGQQSMCWTDVDTTAGVRLQFVASHR